MTGRPAITALQFLDRLRWLDGRLLQVEPYRRRIFERALDAYGPTGASLINLVLAGRAKKNWKSADLVIAGLYTLLFRDDWQGNDVLLVANDADQARNDLEIARKLVLANPDIAAHLEVLKDEIRRRDNRGTMKILPAGNAAGEHGRTFGFVAFDEVHNYRNWALLEALQPDPTRYCLTWVTSYDGPYDHPGAPLHDLKEMGRRGTTGMLFSWYSADFCTDPDWADQPPELRANPSWQSWIEGRGYLEMQRLKLPAHRYRRLHLNLPGSVECAVFDPDVIERVTVAKRVRLNPQPGIDYGAFVDMSGGSSDDAVLAIAHWDGAKAVLDFIGSQLPAPPFNPRDAIARFAETLRQYDVRSVRGDNYGGLTFRADFSSRNIDYLVVDQSKTKIYEDFEVALNAGQVELLDHPKLQLQLASLIVRGVHIDHPSGAHDDWSNAACGACVIVNPMLGRNSADGWLTYMKRIAEQGDAPPSVAQAHASEVVMENSMPKPDPDTVELVCPHQSSTVYGRSGRSYCTAVMGNKWVVRMSKDDAAGQVIQPFWGEVNQELRNRLVPQKPKPQPAAWW